MDVRSVIKYVRMSPKKGHDLAREIQGKTAQDALTLAEFSNRKAGELLAKALKSAIANAEHNFDLDADDLRVKRAVFEDGPIMRRGFYGARGQFKPIAKRTCHVRVVLSDGEPEVAVLDDDLLDDDEV